MAGARLLAAFIPGGPLQFIVAIQNSSETAELSVPRTLQPPDYFFSAVVADAAGRELYSSPRAKAGLKLHPQRPESYVNIAAGDALATVFQIERDELTLEPGHYQAAFTYHSGPYQGPGGKGAPGPLDVDIPFDVA